MLYMVFVKSVVIGQPIREFDVDGRVACLHQFQVHQQTAGTTIAIDEGMDSLKFDVEPGQFGDNMLGAFCIASTSKL